MNNTISTKYTKSKYKARINEFAKIRGPVSDNHELIDDLTGVDHERTHRLELKHLCFGFPSSRFYPIGGYQSATAHRKPAEKKEKTGFGVPQKPVEGKLVEEEEEDEDAKEDDEDRAIAYRNKMDHRNAHTGAFRKRLAKLARVQDEGMKAELTFKR